jgi:hypothetical protein
MKITSGMLGVLMLTLLPLPSHAKTVYMAKMSIDLIQGAKNLDSLDVEIKTFSPPEPPDRIDYFFQNGNLRLENDQVFIIRGGQGTIGAELDQYKTRNIILNKAKNWQSLEAYGCYVKKSIGTDNVTYVFVMSSDYNAPSFCKAKSLSSTSAPTIDLATLSKNVKVIHK